MTCARMPAVEAFANANGAVEAFANANGAVEAFANDEKGRP